MHICPAKIVSCWASIDLTRQLDQSQPENYINFKPCRSKTTFTKACIINMHIEEVVNVQSLCISCVELLLRKFAPLSVKLQMFDDLSCHIWQPIRQCFCIKCWRLDASDGIIQCWKLHFDIFCHLSECRPLKMSCQVWFSLNQKDTSPPYKKASLQRFTNQSFFRHLIIMNVQLAILCWAFLFWPSYETPP